MTNKTRDRLHIEYEKIFQYIFFSEIARLLGRVIWSLPLAEKNRSLISKHRYRKYETKFTPHISKLTMKIEEFPIQESCL